MSHATAATYEEFVSYLDDYERKHYAYSVASQRVADATIAIFQGWFPGFARPLARRGVIAMADPPLREALGLRLSPRAMETAADLALRARALFVRLMPARPASMPHKPRPRTYPRGYALGEIGPAWACEHAARQR